MARTSAPAVPPARSEGEGEKRRRVEEEEIAHPPAPLALRVRKLYSDPNSLMSEESQSFSRELKFTWFIFFVGVIAGVYVLITGSLAFTTGMGIRLLGGKAVAILWTLKLIAYGLVEAFFCARILMLMPQKHPNIPQRIVNLLWLFFIAEFLLSAVMFIIYGEYSETIPSYIQQWLLMAGFYFILSSEFRFLKGTAAYYGSSAASSQIAWVNQYGQKLVGLLERA